MQLFVYFKHFTISSKLIFSIITRRRGCPLHCVYCIRNPTYFILNTTVCPCSVPSEGFAPTITSCLKMKTSCLDRVYFGVTDSFCLCIAFTWERLKACRNCSTRTLVWTCTVMKVSQARHPPVDSEVLRWEWALKCFSYQSRCCQS